MKKVNLTRPLIYLVLVIILLGAISLKKSSIVNARKEEMVTTYGIWTKNGFPVDIYKAKSSLYEIKVKLSCDWTRSTELTSFVTKDIKDQLVVGQWASWDDKSKVAQIVSVAQEMNLNNGLFEVKMRPIVRLPQKRLVFQIDTKRIPKTIFVPNEALVHEEGKNYLWKIENDMAVMVPVVLGTTNGVETIIKKGLIDGDNVVVYGKSLLTAQAKVTVASCVNCKENGND